MMIKSDKGNIFNLILMIVITVPITAMIMCKGISNGDGIITTFGAILLFGYVFFCIRYFVFFSKKIVLHSKGCTIKLYHHERFYPWSYYKTIRFEPYNDFFSFTQGLYDSNILFLRKMRKRSPRNPLMYCVLFCPFSSFIVNFKENSGRNLDEKNRMACIFLANKEEFLGIMSEYQVQIENLNNTGDGDVC